MHKQLETIWKFCILLIILYVVIGPMLFKYLDQPIIGKSLLYQKFKSKFLSGIWNFSNENQGSRKKVGPCDCLKFFDLSISDEFINSTTCSRVGLLI